MSTWDKRHTDRVQLLVDILPTLAKEVRSALKGGTAINLFEHDLPRLSVDIDLTWLPTQDFALDASQISGAVQRLAELFIALTRLPPQRASEIGQLLPHQWVPT